MDVRMNRHAIDDQMQRLRLTEREQETARLLLAGYSYGEIAYGIGITQSGVKGTVSRILHKAGIHHGSNRRTLIVTLLAAHDQRDA